MKAVENSNLIGASRSAVDHYSYTYLSYLFNKTLDVHDISTTLIPSSSTGSVIHYGDLIWDTCQTWLGWGNVEELSWDSGSSLKVLERGAWAGPTPWQLKSRH